MTATVAAIVNVTVDVTAIDKKPGPLLAELSRSIARSIFRVRVCVSTPTPTKRTGRTPSAVYLRLLNFPAL